MPGRNSIEEQIKLAIAILRDGGIVAFPTDTVYGLGCDPFNSKAIREVYRAKNRAPDLPLPLLLADSSEFQEYASSIPSMAWQLAERFLPGGLTLVLRRSPHLPRTLTAGGDTVALRIPNHRVPLALIRGLGGPVAGTSANLSGSPAPLTAAEVRAQLGGKVDLIIEGGESPVGTESTVVDLSSGTPRLVREGAISRKELEKTCGPLQAI
jgi:L-threonylcarbamoyladenylate synthase